jgi:hypothetical protein
MWKILEMYMKYMKGNKHTFAQTKQYLLYLYCIVQIPPFRVTRGTRIAILLHVRS